MSAFPAGTSAAHDDDGFADLVLCSSAPQGSLDGIRRLNGSQHRPAPVQPCGTPFAAEREQVQQEQGRGSVDKVRPWYPCLLTNLSLAQLLCCVRPGQDTCQQVPVSLSPSLVSHHVCLGRGVCCASVRRCLCCPAHTEACHCLSVGHCCPGSSQCQMSLPACQAGWLA